jgi:hypothetical protein
MLTGKVRDWAMTVANVRNELTHLSKDELNTFSGATLHWLSESVYAVVRICLLKECTTDVGLFERLAEKSHASSIGAFTGDAITDARAICKRREAARKQLLDNSCELTPSSGE